MNNMTIKQLIDFYNTANVEQREEIGKLMSNMNVKSRNIDKTEKIAEKIIKKKMIKKKYLLNF